MVHRNVGAAGWVQATVMVMVGSLWLTGCAPSIKGFCEDTCDCEGCTESELDECIEELDCTDDSFECEDGHATFDDSCMDVLDDCDS